MLHVWHLSCVEEGEASFWLSGSAIIPISLPWAARCYLSAPTLISMAQKMVLISASSTSCPHGCSRASYKASEPLSKVRHENISITKTRGCLLCSIPITNWTLKTTCWVNEQMNKCMINKWLSNIETHCDSNDLKVIWHMSPYDLIKTLQEKMINKMIEMCLYLSFPTAVKGQVSKAVHQMGKCDTLCVMTWPEQPIVLWARVMLSHFSDSPLPWQVLTSPQAKLGIPSRTQPACITGCVPGLGEWHRASVPGLFHIELAAPPGASLSIQPVIAPWLTVLLDAASLPACLLFPR